MGGGKSGSTLIEVVVAVLLAAVMVSAIFSVALTAKSESKITEENIAANQAVRQLSAQLHLYVTSYYDYGSNSFIANMPEIPGPSCPTCLTGSGTWRQWSWSLVTMPTWATPVQDNPFGGYVLASGTHNLQHYLAQWFESPPYNARISYTVLPPISSEGPKVSFQIVWQTP